MVAEDSISDSNSSTLHRFIISNSIPDQNQFANQHFDAYGTDSVSNIPYGTQSLPLSSQCLGERISRSVDLHTSQLSDESDASHGTRLMDLLGTSNEAAHQAQRLSLSLGSVSCRQFDPGYLNTAFDRMINDYSFVRNGFSLSAGSQNQSCSISHGTESFSAAIGSSKYLKPAQSLLEEMVGVGGKDIDAGNQKYVEKLSQGGLKGSFGLASEIKAEFFSNELLLPEKHGTFVSLLKLLALLDEVERRYEEYYHHMEELVSSFEVIAGLGAGKSYTALALQAMSKHFCSLRKVILCQIRVSKRKIEKDMPRISARLSQLSLFDQESRHHRIPLQLIMQNSRQAWRPIRGLPENSVMILRAWLFEHFLHPYPKESEKLMLASQTGLSKNQISNWFINARVRLWKPMIEEMYKEEIAEPSTELDQASTSSCTTREGAGDSAAEIKWD